MRADNRDGMDFRAIDREHPVTIFKQDRALLGETARCFKAALHIHNALLRGVVDDPAGEFGTQDASYMVVELGGRDLARLYCFFELFPEKLVERFFIIQSSRRRLYCAVRSGPVRHHKTFEAPGFLQHLRQQIFVFAREVAIHRIVGAHYRPGIGDSDPNLEG